MNEKFYSLSEKKQMNIINAGMKVFAQYEYKNASTDLIAVEAGISKGLLFYYFHNKKEFYLYLYNYLYQVMVDEVVDQNLLDIKDFFELFRTGAAKKMRTLERNPYIMEFAMRAFYSEKEAVSDDLKNLNNTYELELFKQFFEDIDMYKFKEEYSDIFHIYKMLRWMTDGYLHDLQMAGEPYDMDVLMKEFDSWMTMFKALVYKEEYQNDESN